MAILILFENQVITFAQISRVYSGAHNRSVSLDHQYVTFILSIHKFEVNLPVATQAKDIPWPRVRTVRHSLSFCSRITQDGNFGWRWNGKDKLGKSSYSSFRISWEI
jgi:hypothetical protein